MKVGQIAELLDGKVVCGQELLDRNVNSVFASDLMSDVLTLKSDDLVLMTGLGNVQTIRTAEMSDISTIIFVRNKKVNQDMLELAAENDMILIECPYSMFRASGILYQAGLEPIY
ncbi:MAG: PucR family transcriptional regulator ligand-binding domain-containing protein [Bacteroidetes bacterium]|nr:PucR family transcriptional regulator ligand-binding domain-containing protein [Bacteroidota bacterium]